MTLAEEIFFHLWQKMALAPKEELRNTIRRAVEIADIFDEECAEYRRKSAKITASPAMFAPIDTAEIPCSSVAGPDVTKDMDALTYLLMRYCTPENDQRDLVKLTCSAEFEPHGRASETWDLVWRLTLPQMPYYYKSLDVVRNTVSWKRGSEKLHTYFKGKTPQQCFERAIEFLIWYQQQPESNQ